MSTEGFGPDSVFATPAEDNGQYRISRSLVRSAEGSTVPLTRVKCLVSMTTPHDIRLHGSAVTPAFVEFDTSLEGFGLDSISFLFYTQQEVSFSQMTKIQYSLDLVVNSLLM